MPSSGEKNRTFAVYRNVCCGAEIVITIGAEFPVCPDHRNLNTIWRQIDTRSENVIILSSEDVVMLKKKTKSAAAA